LGSLQETAGFFLLGRDKKFSVVSVEKGEVSVEMLGTSVEIGIVSVETLGMSIERGIVSIEKYANLFWSKKASFTKTAQSAEA
jgi:hypothetical protein